MAYCPNKPTFSPLASMGCAVRCDFKITSVCEFLSETAVSGLYVVTTQRLHARCSSRTMPDSPPMLRVKMHVRCLSNAAAGVLIATKQRRGCVAPNSFPRVFFKRPAAFNDQVRSKTQRVPVLQRRESKTKISNIWRGMHARTNSGCCARIASQDDRETIKNWLVSANPMPCCQPPNASAGFFSMQVEG